MTGPEHYREAEKLLEEANRRHNPDATLLSLVAEAQAHATLAQVAATISAAETKTVPGSGLFDDEGTVYTDPANVNDWHEVIS